MTGLHVAAVLSEIRLLPNTTLCSGPLNNTHTEYELKASLQLLMYVKY